MAIFLVLACFSSLPHPALPACLINNNLKCQFRVSILMILERWSQKAETQSQPSCTLRTPWAHLDRILSGPGADFLQGYTTIKILFSFVMLIDYTSLSHYASGKVFSPMPKTHSNNYLAPSWNSNSFKPNDVSILVIITFSSQSLFTHHLHLMYL